MTAGRGRLWIALGCGVLASVAAVGLAMVTSAGADLFRFCVGVAAMFFIAGIASGRERVAARAAAVAVAGCAVVVALAAARIAFATAPWLVAYIVTASVFATVGAVVRAQPRAIAIAVSVLAWLALVTAGRVAVSWLVEGSAFERVDEPVPALAVAAVGGGELRSADNRGKVIVLAFWASWCVPCRAELSELDDIADHYRDEPDVVVWWVNTGRDGDTLELARDLARASRSRLTFAFDAERVASTLGIDGLPAIAVLDPDGRLRVRHAGYDASEHLAASLEREIDRLRGR